MLLRCETFESLVLFDMMITTTTTTTASELTRLLRIVSAGPAREIRPRERDKWTAAVDGDGRFPLSSERRFDRGISGRMRLRHRRCVSSTRLAGDLNRDSAADP